MKRINNVIQLSLLTFIMAASLTVLYDNVSLAFLHVEIMRVELFFVAMVLVSSLIVSDVRASFQKVLKYTEREDRLPLWQVGIGMLFYFAQVGFVEMFMRQWMDVKLDGMPLYLVISFLNAFLCTVIYQEIFYRHAVKENVKINPMK